MKKSEDEEGPSAPSLKLAKKEKRQVRVRKKSKVPGKQGAWSEMQNEDLPETINGKQLVNCTLRGCNITGTRSHDIKLEKYVQDLIATLKALIEGEEGTANKLVAIASEGYRKELQEEKKSLEQRLNESLDEYTSNMERKFNELHTYVKDVAQDVVDFETSRLEAESSNKNESVLACLDSALKEHMLNSCLAEDGCSVRGTPDLPQPEYLVNKAIPIINLSVHLQDVRDVAPWHNVRGNFREKTQMYVCPYDGYYKAELRSKAEIYGGGKRTAYLFVNNKDKDVNNMWIGSTVNDSDECAYLFSASTPVFFAYKGTVIYPAVKHGGPGKLILDPDCTYFSVEVIQKSSF
jgi:hypothetical protein